MKYHLSNKQAEKLLIRGTEMSIALPAPSQLDNEPIQWAKKVLDGQVAACVRDAYEGDIEVDLIKSGDPSSLTYHLGRIIQEGEERSPTVTMVVVVAMLVPPQARNKFDQLQWPKSLTLDDGRKFPEKPSV